MTNNLLYCDGTGASLVRPSGLLRVYCVFRQGRYAPDCVAWGLRRVVKQQHWRGWRAVGD